ncbi:unnamed protein product [Somion occarium]|uniref:Protein kinase domain-containing protein n=1 Tax=Somion occarium TaxID=3059160 RepID=A0ABP1CEP7_9APHY
MAYRMEQIKSLYFSFQNAVSIGLILLIEGPRTEKAKLDVCDRKVIQSIEAYIRGVPSSKGISEDLEILSLIVKHIKTKESALDLTEEQAARALQFTQKLLDDDALWARFSRAKHLDTKRTRLCSLGLYLSRRCRDPPSSLFSVTTVRGHLPQRAGVGSDVFVGTIRGQKVAVKRLRYFLNLPDVRRPKAQRAFFREALVWTQLRHPNVLRLQSLDVTTYPNMPSMIFPWLEKGNIVETRNRMGSMPDTAQLDEWLLQVASGMSYLHDKKIVHGDLRGANILISDDMRAQVTDFGLITFARDHCRDFYSWSDAYERWNSPELIDPPSSSVSKTGRTVASDVFAFAFVCTEVYSGQQPFGECNLLQVHRKVLSGERPEMPTSPVMSSNLCSMVEMCWSQAAGDRPTMTDVVARMKKFAAA